MLYNKVVIPTHDFGVVPVLVSWMGFPAFQDAIRSGAIEFVRPKDLLGYAGNGAGISGFRIISTPQNPFDWWQKAIFGPMEEAPDLQLRYMCSSLSDQQRGRLVAQVLERSRSLEWDNDLFMKAIVHESYTDIMKSRVLSAFVLSHEPRGARQAALTRLNGTTANQVRVLSQERINDGVDLVLRVAEINLEILISNMYGEADIGTSAGADDLIRSKLVRCGASPAVASKFQRLLELASIPDIRPAVESGALPLSEIWKLRQSKDGERFREWLMKADSGDERELEKAYVACLARTPLISSLPARALRFVITAAAGSLQPIMGIALAGIDSFFVEKWLAGFSPKLFLDRIRKLPHSDESKIGG